jgi:hypothetical protein
LIHDLDNDESTATTSCRIHHVYTGRRVVDVHWTLYSGSDKSSEGDYSTEIDVVEGKDNKFVFGPK